MSNPANIVFVTSTTYDGNLGGLSGADAKCQARATAAGLGGTFKSLLSDSTTSAASHLTTHSTAPYKLVDGTLVANSWTGLTSGSLASPLYKDEFGNPAGQYPFQNVTTTAWTNTNPDGSARNDFGWNCNDWTSNADDGSVAWLGYTIFSDGRWT